MMKSLFVILSLALLLLSAPTARAQDLSLYGSPSKPVATTPEYIAMVFSKMSGMTPDFESWAKNSDDYKAASTFDRLNIQTRRVQELKGVYNLLTLQEPIVVETPVKMSEYSFANKGFFIDNFKNDTFFPVSYNGLSYAIIPQGIMDKQWIASSGFDAKAIDDAAKASEGRLLSMSLLLLPKFADKSAAISIQGKDYWPLAVEIRKMTLYDPRSNRILWESAASAVEVNQKQQELIKLRQ